MHFQFAEDLVKMPFGGSYRDRKLAGNLLIGQTEIDETKGLDLPRSQWLLCHCMPLLRRAMSRADENRQLVKRVRGFACKVFARRNADCRPPGGGASPIDG